MLKRIDLCDWLMEKNSNSAKTNTYVIGQAIDDGTLNSEGVGSVWELKWI